jgi:hypothetical protein
MPNSYPRAELGAAFLIGLGVSACSPEPEGPPADPRLGRACFELHRPSLPPGSQYEGVEAGGAGVVIKVMNGVEVVRLECATTAAGEVRLP